MLSVLLNIVEDSTKSFTFLIFWYNLGSVWLERMYCKGKLIPSTPFKTKAFPYYEELCMVYGKDHAIGKNAEDPADVVEQLDKEGGDDVNLNEDAFDSSNIMGTYEA